MSPQPGKAFARTARRRRRHPRYRAEFPVAVTLFSGEEHHRLDAHCRDLSAAGIGVLVASELNLGEVASLAFSLGDHPWEVQAVLRHRRGYHYGFEFLSLSQQQIAALAAYLSGLERADSD
ncbi:MAG TPA: PilZ domain-containing protein [Candidatus Sulfotelmatobacter sp.]|nr:PilZ domain-containing protein [Candidatus Sulfotelmatobacter sp.]